MKGGKPGRTLCAISTSGQWPYYRGDFAPDIWDGRTIDFVPCLQTMGEYENATGMAARGVRGRAEHPRTPLSARLSCRRAFRVDPRKGRIHRVLHREGRRIPPARRHAASHRPDPRGVAGRPLAGIVQGGEMLLPERIADGRPQTIDFDPPATPLFGAMNRAGRSSSKPRATRGPTSIFMSPRARLCGFILANAAELMRHTYDKWDAAAVARCERMFREVIYPVIENFATFANGNWDAACIKGVMAIGVFCNDREIFDRGVDYYYNGSGNGRLTHYVIDEEGQCQESGRDQPHTMFGPACLTEACEVGLKQGLDMYGAVDYRLMKGFEYTSKYNLGHDVPFHEWHDKTGKYHHYAISEQDRGQLRAVFELPYNHYAKRAGKVSEIPFLAQAAAQVRPEGQPWTADDPDYGTLLFTLE